MSAASAEAVQPAAATNAAAHTTNLFITLSKRNCRPRDARAAARGKPHGYGTTIFSRKIYREF
jgi:hypothetical protein